MKISVIVPIYNENPQFLKECVDSIIAQTYKDLEIILVDDGSESSIGAVIDEYGEKDNRITVIHQENKGLSFARNAGIDIANGDLIMFVDSDDWIEADTCEKIVKVFESTECDVAVYRYRMVYENGETKEIQFSKYGTVSDGAEKAKRYIEQDFGLGAWNKVSKANLFKTLRFPESRLISEDLTTMYDLLQNADKVFVMDECFYNYRRRDNSLSVAPIKGLAIGKVTYSVEVGKKVRGTYPELHNEAELFELIAIIEVSRRLYGTDDQEEMNKLHDLLCRHRKTLWKNPAVSLKRKVYYTSASINFDFTEKSKAAVKKLFSNHTTNE